MARIIHDFASRSQGLYRVYTDLDFWDARKILRGLAKVKRNFCSAPPGDQFPTQVVVEQGGTPEVKAEIEKRLKRAIPSPPRHLIVQSIIFSGSFTFDRRRYYPDRWSPGMVLFFMSKRLPTNQPVIESPYKWVEITISGNTVSIEQHQGVPPQTHRTRRKQDESTSFGPSCF
jgi:hypothetical protein